MARTRTVNADKLVERLYTMPIHVPTGGCNYYGGDGDLNRAVDDKIRAAIETSLRLFRDHLAIAINETAELHGPCLLCAPKEGDCQPPKLY